MAVLQKEQILEFYKNPDPRIIEAKKLHKQYLVHVHGIGVAEYLERIEGLESKEKYEIRKRLARSNKDFFASLFRHADKIFSAKGGSISYGEESETKTKQLQQKLFNIVDGLSLSKWLENIWLDKYAVDPNGLILIEHKDSDPYPTYKSILTIRNYKQKGQSVEWVIFEPYKKEVVKDSGKEIEKEYFRVYDDRGDYTYSITGDIIELEKDETFTNPWGYVPAQIVSDLINPVDEFKKSSIYEQAELADEYLRENTIKTLCKYHHGFPMFWQYLQNCPNCKGTGMVDGKKCPVCNGSRFVGKKDVSDILYVKIPEDNEPKLAPELAGYVVPPIESIKMMTEENKLLRDMMTFSHWGTVIETTSVEKTATEVIVNASPIEGRLNKYSDSFEITYQSIVNMVGTYLFKEDYDKCQFKAGRNYQIKGVDQLNQEYKELKTAKVGTVQLDLKLEEIISAKYSNDSKNLIINLKLIKVEPFPHNTIDEVKSIGIDIDLFYEKVFYSDWRISQSNETLFTTEVEKLKESLAEYTQQKLIKIKENAKVQKDNSNTLNP